MAERSSRDEPRIVGCSSVFQQHCASLALLKRIRELSPDTVLLMGGANCEGDMGVQTLQIFPWVDCIVSGEADALFPRALQGIARTRPRRRPDIAAGRRRFATTITETCFRSFRSSSRKRRALLIPDMDSLPLPDYGHYFRNAEASTLSNMIKPGLLAESSRGCWWGEKFHCTFCGLNGEGMKYR